MWPPPPPPPLGRPIQPPPHVCHPQASTAVPQPATLHATTAPPAAAVNALLVQMPQQNQQMFLSQLQQSQALITNITVSIDALKEATIKSATAAQQQVNDTQEAKEKKGPAANKLPKFANKPNESFIDWYEDDLCILTLSKWSDLYDAANNDIYSTTTDYNHRLSEHL